MGVGHQGVSNSRGPGGVPANLGLRHPRSSSVAAYEVWFLFEQISLRGIFYWDHHFCTLEAGLEILGPSPLQILYLVGH